MYEYKVNTDSMDWEKWEYPFQIAEPDFSSMLVPTVETTRASYLLSQLHSQKKYFLMT